MNTEGHHLLVAATVAACASPHLEERTHQLTPDPRYEVRISETAIGANGHTKREVFVFGTKADGTFATDDVIVGLDRASAGSFTKAALALGPLGATTHFIPCDPTAPDCYGPAIVTLARASAPSTPIASVNIELVPPTHISTLAPCLGGGSVMHLDGNDFIRNGMLDVIEWGFEFTQAAPEIGATEIRLSLTPRKPTQGNIWNLVIDSAELGAPLAVGLYENAARPSASTPNRPGLSVTGNGRGCNTISGAFEVHELAVSAGKVDRLAVSFEQHCDGSTTTLLEGCFRYVKP